MTFGWSQTSSLVDDKVAASMVKRFIAVGGRQIDTARIYAAGDTEPMIGRIIQNPDAQGASVRLATKAHPSQPGGLSSRGLRAQLEASLEALQVERVDALYLHQPDPEHDLAESLECVHSLVTEGKVGQLGLSNYSALEIDRCCFLCEAEGWTRPSVYQGLYNPLNRMAEEQLLPALRRHGISFVAYNPLAAGLLTGKHQRGTDVLQGRFKDNPNYLPRFYTDANFEALTRLQEACAAHDLSLLSATYAWLLQHSALAGELGDGLLLGASSEGQFVENLAACTEPKELPAAVQAAFDGAWSLCREGAFPYWRSYSKDQPDRERLPPGASYEAAKK